MGRGVSRRSRLPQGPGRGAPRPGAPHPHPLPKRGRGGARGVGGARGLVRGLAAGLLAVAFLAAGGVAAAQGGAQDGAPARVVSLNLCTDQLAMLLAAPGQLVAVSNLAADPMMSAMAGAAARYRATRGQAEEVFLLRPDLVLAGSFTTRATVELLRRLGVRVELFPPPASLADVAAQMRAVGAALGRAAEGERLALSFEAGLAALAAAPGDASGDASEERPRAALYYAGGYSGGAESLAGDIVVAAGFANIAEEAGLPSGGRLALELLILAMPDLVITGASYPGASRAEEILRHPAFAGLRRAEGVSDADWVCGTPRVLDAIARLGALRRGAGR